MTQMPTRAEAAHGDVTSYPIISLSKSRFTTKWEDGTLYILKRIAEAEAETYGPIGAQYPKKFLEIGSRLASI
jgi:hypothetical protein